MGNTITTVDLLVQKAAGFVGFATKSADAGEKASLADMACAYPWLASQPPPLAPASYEEVEALARRMLNK